MCAAFATKRRRTSGSKTRVRGKNGAVRGNGVVNKYCVLRKNDDALDSNDALDSAVTRVEENSRAVGVTGEQLPPSADCRRPETSLPAPPLRKRSEERRVGKECRSRWSPYH